MKAAAHRAPLRRTERVVGQAPGGFDYIVAPATSGRLRWLAEEWRAGKLVRRRRFATEPAADARVDSWMNHRTLMERNPL